MTNPYITLREVTAANTAPAIAAVAYNPNPPPVTIPRKFTDMDTNIIGMTIDSDGNVTPPAGLYRLSGVAPFAGLSKHVAFLKDRDNDTVLATGTSGSGDFEVGSFQDGHSHFVSNQFELDGATKVGVDSWFSKHNQNIALGIACNSGYPEVYASVTLELIGVL